MKRNYELPEWEIVIFDEDDVVRTSPMDSDSNDGDFGNDLGDWD